MAGSREDTGVRIAPDVVVVGAGLAGLACAVRLHEAGVPVAVFESGDGVGGRVRTDVVDGFRLDRGFQVLLTAYAEVAEQLDLAALAPRAFRSGALVRYGGRFHRIGDPFREPSSIFSTLTSPIGSLRDKVRVAALRRSCLRGPYGSAFAAPETTALEELRALGFGPEAIDRFFRPFFAGIFLERDLATSSRLLRFLFRMFAAGAAVLPRDGMEAVPRQLAARLPEGALHFGREVVAVRTGELVLRSGEVVPCPRVVVATDGAAAAQLLDGVPQPRWCGVACLYFVASEPPIDEPLLVLNGDGVGPVNNLCVPTQVAPEYGPGDKALVSVSVLGERADRADLTERVRDQLADWFGPGVHSWRHLRTYRIARALPRQEPGWLSPPLREARLGAGVYIAGDHRANASIDGALTSGRRAAEAVLEDRARNAD